MKERIKKILSETLQTAVDDSATQQTCPSWDSLRHLNIIVELETEFCLSFEPEEIVEMKSVEKIEEIIRNRS